jgi:protein tyrosine/serine phosphatase
VAPAGAASNLSGKFANIQIGNFGVINDNYFRGAQPQGQDFRDLAALGVKMVIDLTKDGRPDERGMVEQAGMKFYRIPMTTSDRPADHAVAQFLRLVNDPANQPVFVHCQGGRHRTGVMTAVYRMTQDGWTPDRAYGEMKQFRFEGFPGHPVLKSFVYDFYNHLDHLQIANNQHNKQNEGSTILPAAAVASAAMIAVPTR